MLDRDTQCCHLDDLEAVEACFCRRFSEGSTQEVKEFLEEYEYKSILKKG